MILTLLESIMDTLLIVVSLASGLQIIGLAV